MKPLSEKSKLRMAMLADWIDTNHIIIDMWNWSNSDLEFRFAEAPDETCGTAFCCAGSCTMMNFWGYKLWQFGRKDKTPGTYAKWWLCLSADQEDALFTPDGYDYGLPHRDNDPVSTMLQKSRLLKVLRGKRRLYSGWLLGVSPK